MLTLYFAGAISGGRTDVGLYRQIIAALEAEGHQVLAGAVAAEHVTSSGETLDSFAIFDRDLGWIAAADILIAEVSMPSTGVGYEIATARYQYDIPVICLYRPAHTARCTAEPQATPTEPPPKPPPRPTATPNGTTDSATTGSTPKAR